MEFVSLLELESCSCEKFQDSNPNKMKKRATWLYSLFNGWPFLRSHPKVVFTLFFRPSDPWKAYRLDWSSGKINFYSRDLLLYLLICHESILISLSSSKRSQSLWTKLNQFSWNCNCKWFSIFNNFQWVSIRWILS